MNKSVYGKEYFFSKLKIHKKTIVMKCQNDDF